jgi:hypothetical protein
MNSYHSKSDFTELVKQYPQHTDFIRWIIWQYSTKNTAELLEENKNRIVAVVPSVWDCIIASVLFIPQHGKMPLFIPLCDIGFAVGRDIDLILRSGENAKAMDIAMNSNDIFNSIYCLYTADLEDMPFVAPGESVGDVLLSDRRYQYWEFCNSYNCISIDKNNLNNKQNGI